MLAFAEAAWRAVIRRHVVKTCCGQKQYIFECETAIRKTHLPAFKQAGYAFPPRLLKSGLFYVLKPNFVASAHFGSTKIQVRASGPKAVQLMNEFEKLLDSLTKK